MRTGREKGEKSKEKRELSRAVDPNAHSISFLDPEFRSQIICRRLVNQLKCHTWYRSAATTLQSVDTGTHPFDCGPRPWSRKEKLKRKPRKNERKLLIIVFF